MYECSFTEGWTDKDLLLLENKLKSENFIFFKSFCEDFKKMEQQLFSKVEPETKVVLMKKESPSFYLIESKVFHFTYTYFYKLRNFFNAFKFSLQQRNFVPVVCVARAMFETTCCQLYFIEKINKQIRNLSKSNEITGESLGRAMYQIAKELNKSHTGTSFDWEKHLYNGFKPKTAKHLNINDPLRMVEKLTNKPINKYYALLSEMTHPNFGSNTLVIEKRGEESKDLFELVLGDGVGSDSLLWFFDNLSETLSELIKTSLEAIRLSNANAAYFQELTDRGSNADKFDESIH